MKKKEPCSGCVMRVEAFVNLLPQPWQERARQLIKDRDAQGFHALLLKELKHGISPTVPPPSYCFVLGDEDTPGSNMERGVVYAYYEPDVLWYRRKTTGGQVLFGAVGEKDFPFDSVWSSDAVRVIWSS